MPGNDDAIRAIDTYLELFSGAVLDGIQAEMGSSGEDVGAQEEAPVETLPAEEQAAGTAEPTQTEATGA